MMRRLRELYGAEDPVMTELAEMVRSVDDTEPRQGAEERVLQVLSRQRPCRSWWWLHAVIVLVMVIAVRIEAFFGPHDGGWPSATAPSIDDQPRAAAPSVASHQSILESPAPPLAVEGEPDRATVRALPIPDSQVAPSPVQRKAPRTAREAASPPDLSRPSTATPVEPSKAPQQLATDVHSTANAGPAPLHIDEPALVYDATRILRRGHDTPTAIQMLETYRVLSPSGDLAEEALALLIEARIAAFDDKASLARVAAGRVDAASYVRTLGREYLQRYPQGRSRALAEQAARWSNPDASTRPGTVHEASAAQQRGQRDPFQASSKDLVELYRINAFHLVVRECSDTTVTEENAIVCTLAACQVGDSAKAERWVPMSPLAVRHKLGQRCSAIAQDNHR